MTTGLLSRSNRIPIRLRKEMNMNIKILGLRIIVLLFACILGIGCFFSAPALADDHGKYKMNFENEDQHRLGFMESDNEGNETAGQIAAWLLVVANFTITCQHFDHVDQSIYPSGARIQKGFNEFKPISKKAPHALTLLLEPGDRRNCSMALAFIQMQVHSASGMGPFDTHQDDKIRDYFEIEDRPQAFSKNRLSDTYSTLHLYRNDYGADDWPHDC